LAGDGIAAMIGCHAIQSPGRFRAGHLLPPAIALAALGFGLAACANQSSSAKPMASAPFSQECTVALLYDNLLDTTEDGTVAPGEWAGAFQQMDLDGDGQLSQDELAKACDRARARAAAKGGAPVRGMTSPQP
jgi:hypothetical protein